MSTICRTCLQKSNRTYKTNQTFNDFGGGEIKISVVLRFCMPELYLGLSSKPEICHECAENLKVVYFFKKKCLNTENIIGNFLKNARCTAKSVDLHDVLAYFDEQAKLELELENAKQRITPNTQGIVSKWDDVNETPINEEDDSVLEVRQSAPNPTNSKFNKNKLKFCEETGLFVNQEGEFFDSTGIRVDRSQIEAQSVIIHKETPISVVRITKERPDFIQTTDSLTNFCKITSVFSLSDSIENTDKDNDVNADIVNEANAANVTESAFEGLVDIKEEPLDVEINGELINFKYTLTDEETLDASETGSYDSMRCDSNLQGIIDNLPEINDTNQYVDVPEFVQINNFGLKELEELRRQQKLQQDDKTEENKSYVLNFKNKIPTMTESSNLHENDTKAAENQKEEVLTKVPLSTLPDTLFINGKQMVKCPEGYRLKEDSTSAPIKILSPIRKLVKTTFTATQESASKNQKYYSIVPQDYFKKHFQKISDLEKPTGSKPPLKYSEKIPELIKTFLMSENTNVLGKVQDSKKKSVPTFPNVNSGSQMDLEQKNPEQILCKEDFQENQLKPKITKTGPKPVARRRRRKIKIVPINDKSKLGSQTGAKLDLRVGRPPSKQIKIAPKPEDNDVVVLFTNYTVEGEYINDHDYLINPYKRNKVLIEEGSQWYCMCYICHSKHHVYDHVPHMNTHESICKVCKVDLGNPYMLNVHVKVHTKPCKQCTERVPYGEWDTHLEQHFQDEIEFEKGLQKKIYHVRTRRKRPKKDDDAPVSFNIRKIEHESEKEESQSEDLGQSSSVKTEEDSSNNEEWSSSGSSSKKLRKRKRRITNDEDIVEVERSSRVLRSNVRKSYSETESEDIISNDLHVMRNCLI